MRTIIAVETASKTCSIALYIDGKFIKIFESDQPKDHVRALPIFTRDIVKENRINFTDLDAIAISKGPGSYTGLRVGMSFVKGLAYSLGIPIIPISTTEAINSINSIKEKHWVGLYSHKNFMFAQMYKGTQERSEAQCLSFENLIDYPLYAVDMENMSYVGKIFNLKTSANGTC